MSFHGSLPHWFLVVVIIVVAVFLLKSLVKFAIIAGIVGLVVYLVWWQDILGRFTG